MEKIKIQKVEYEKYKLFENLKIDFRDSEGKELNTIVIVGENGTGKTTLLKSIFEAFNIERWKDYRECDNKKIELTPGSYRVMVGLLEREVGTIHEDMVCELESEDAKIVYMPAEINFDKVNKVDNTLSFVPNFLNIVDQEITQNIPSFIATKINSEIFKNRNKTIGEVIDKVCEEINSIFEVMDLDVKLIGLSDTSDTKPIFQNTGGDEFDIVGLSSGEKQLFLRSLALKFLNVNNSIILIDEPEISLHPQLQRKIIDVYENIGVNNQIIIATHSPHIIGDIEVEQLRLMKKTPDGVKIVDYKELNETYGKNIGEILSTTMNVESLRNEDITEKLEEVYRLLDYNQYESAEFDELFAYLKRYLGELDKDIMRIRLDISVRKKRNTKNL